MAIEILRPNAAGDETSITSQYPDSGAHWDKVDEETADDDSTYISTSSTAYQRDLYNLPAHSVGSGTINSIKIYFKIKSSSSDYYTWAKPSQKSGDTVTDGTQQDRKQFWGTFSRTYTTNPATGNAYTWDEIDALQIGLQLRITDANGSALCTQVYVEVYYTLVSPFPSHFRI